MKKVNTFAFVALAAMTVAYGIVAYKVTTTPIVEQAPPATPATNNTADIEKKLDVINQKLEDTKKVLEEQKKRQDDIDAKIEKLRKQNSLRVAFEDNLKCLADNIYYEAGFEPEEGKIAVAQVTINRLHDPNYPKTVCGVVYERHRTKANRIAAAFSWTLTPYRPKGPKNKTIYGEVLEIARNVLTNKERSGIIDDDVKFYHASYIHAPEWADEHEVVAKIGHHVFYK